VYQSNYNQVARHMDADLFPVLQKLSKTFNALFPLVGGFLLDRFDQNTLTGKLHLGMYKKPSLLAALQKWAQPMPHSHTAG
jgi:aflatoxin B1 aldehyde reductase